MNVLIGRIRWQPTLQTGLTLLLCSAVIVALAQSFHTARWIRGDAPVMTGFTLGLLCGLALARTRWNGWSAAGYSVIASLAAVSQALGGVVQLRGMLEAPGFWQAVELLSLRATAFYFRVNGWFSAALNGKPVEDNGFFIFLAAMLAWNTSVWLIWWVRRRKTALAGLLPGGALLAFNIHLSQQNSALLLLFLLCAVLLLARTALLRRYADWDRRNVDYPYDLGLGWGMTASALAVAIGLIAWGAGLIGTPQAWRNMSNWLEQVRQQTSQTAERLFPNVNPPPPREDWAVVNAVTPNLGEIGAPLPLGKTTILTVSLSDPPPPPPDAADVPGVQAPVHYWRSQIYGAYTGRGWEPVVVTARDAVAANSVRQSQLPPGRYALEQHFIVLAQHGDTLYAANQPVTASQGAQLVSAESSNSLLIRGELDEYDVTSYAARVNAAELREAGNLYPFEVTAAYLQIPASLPERVSQLTERIVSGAGSPYDQALRIQDYLRQNFSYDLTVDRAPENADAVDDFLFASQSGFCSHFATAMAVMLRTRGIPARVVSGYAMGSFDFERGEYRVPADAAHAWVEVFFPGYGWIEFEPTAAVGAISYPEVVPGSLLPQPENELKVGGSAWTWALAAGGILVLAAGVLLVVHRRLAWTRQGSTLSGQCAAFYRQVRRTLGWLGLSAPAAVTPQEFLRQQRLTLQESPRLNAALQAVTALHEQAVYSPHPPESQEMRSAWRAWQDSWRERWQLAWKRLTKKPSQK
ncbi:MAG TPA: transglutaminase domain-containing protein [Bellilinea sp.]|nr:transglutaminase domain-containing protein [Bellilinea sp.]